MSEILLAAAKRGIAVPPGPLDTDALAALAAAIFAHPACSGRRTPRELAYLKTAQRHTISTRFGELSVWEWRPQESVLRTLGFDHAPLVGLAHGWEGHGAQMGAFAAPL